MLQRILAMTCALALASLLPIGAAAAHEEHETDRATDNVSLVRHLHYTQGTDLQFQRRTGRQILDGQEISGTRDYLVAGHDASRAVGEPPPEGVGVFVFDVTDAANPVELAAIACTGYHADVAIYENLFIQGIDSPATNTGCSEEFDPNGVDVAEAAGIRIFDATDPANPIVAGFVTEEELGTSVHNLTTVPWAGLAYIAGSNFTTPEPHLSIVDLTDPDFPATPIPMNDITPLATAECHDIGLDAENELAFCAAVEQTFIWDISEPMSPESLGRIVNPDIQIHHAARLAPDGTTLVVNDEMGGAAVAPGCLGTESIGLVGALWFYDITDPSSPSPMGNFSTAELAPKMPCTSHFYNFIPGTELLVVGWYKSGMIVVDYTDPMQPVEHAAYTPTGGDFWAAYYWHGHLFGSSFEGGSYGGDPAMEAGGLWILELAGVGDVEPSIHDQGTSWAPWTSQLETVTDERELADEPGDPVLPATGGGIAVIGLALGLAALGTRRSLG